MTNSVVRYSDAELAEFKALIEKKLEKAQEQFKMLQEQILEITENSSDEHGGDWVDDSSINNDVEMLNNMAIRQRMYMRELENALVRIRNRSYGICAVTGELIDKRRLMAVPTTTKSLAAKTLQQRPTLRERAREERPASGKKKATPPKVITKIIRKSAQNSPKPISSDDGDDLFDDDLLFEEDEDSVRRAVSDLEVERDMQAAEEDRADEEDRDEDIEDEENY